jgi:hypothetical protein
MRTSFVMSILNTGVIREDPRTNHSQGDRAGHHAIDWIMNFVSNARASHSLFVTPFALLTMP